MKRTTLVYLIKDRQWLMLYRNKKKNDVNQGKWIGVGGKCEPLESYADCALRETKEETGLEVQDLKECGCLHFHCVGFEEEEIVVYRGTQWTGDLRETTEGDLAWIPEEKILSLSLWEGDRVFLKRMLADDSSSFDLSLYYDEQGDLIRVEEKK